MKGARNLIPELSAQAIQRSNRKSHKRDNLTPSLPKYLRNGALQPVAELFQRIERDVLFSQFEPVQGRVGNAGFAGELLKSEVAAPFTEERGQLLRQSLLSHDRMLQPLKSRMWDILLAAADSVG